MKTKRSIIIVLLCILICLPLLLGGCTNPWDIKKEENGYYYFLCKENGEPTKSAKKARGAVILGRVNNDEAIDELVIPQKLGGLPVKKIGESYKPLEGCEERYSIDCTNVGAVVIDHSCYINEYCFNDLGGELVINADVRTTSVSQFVPYEHRTTTKLIRFNVPPRSLTDYNVWSMLWEGDWTNDDARQEVLVEFDADGGRQKTYAYVVPINSCIIDPELPTKDGYTFAGWFADEHYKTEWHFDTYTVVQDITLHAKWIKA